MRVHPGDFAPTCTVTPSELLAILLVGGIIGGCVVVSGGWRRVSSLIKIHVPNKDITNAYLPP